MLRKTDAKFVKENFSLQTFGEQINYTRLKNLAQAGNAQVKRQTGENKMTFIKTILYAGLFILSSVLAAAAQNSEASLPESIAGQRAAAYFSAFNSGDEKKMRAFFTENVSAKSLKQQPVAEWLKFYREMRPEVLSLDFRKVLESKPDKVSILVRSERGEWLRFDFMFEPKPPHKLMDIGIDEGEDPSLDEKIPAGALTKARFGSVLDEYLKKLGADDEFSGVVLIAKKDQTIFQKAVGRASVEFNVPNRADTKFNLGSINKLFTQIAIAQLVSAGKLSYEDKVGRILPRYPNKAVREKVAVKHLLTMSSGIGDIFGKKYDAVSKDKLRSNSDYLQLFAAAPLQFEPGARQEYSNGGYIVLGLLIEKLSGQSYYDYVRQNIYQKAGMTNTDSYNTNDPATNLAQGYTREGVASGDKSARRNNVLTRPARGSAAGGGYSTAEDMLRLSLALQSGKLRRHDFSSPNGQAQKLEDFGINGAAEGISALFEINVKDAYTIIVLSNYDPPSANEVGKVIRRLLSRLSE